MAQTDIQALLKSAEQALQTNQIDTAVMLYQRALTRARELKSPKSESEALRGLGNASFAAEKFLTSLDYFEKALAISQAIKDKVGEVSALARMGEIYSSRGQLLKVLEVYQQALPLVQELGPKDEEASILNSLGDASLSTNQPQKAAEFYQQAQALFHTLGNKIWEGAVLNSLGNTYRALEQPTKALEVFGQALRLFQQLNHKAFQANVLDNFGTVYVELDQEATAEEFYLKALAIRRTLSNKAETAGTLNRLSNVYSQTGRYQKALKVLQEALTLYQAVGDPMGVAKVSANLGATYLYTGQFQQAAALFEQALPVFQQQGMMFEEGQLRTNLGSVYKDTGQLPKALEYYQRALTLFLLSGNRSNEAKVLLNMASLYQDMHQITKALELFQKALALSQELGRQGDEAIAHFSLGGLYLDSKQPQKAEPFYQQALTLFRSMGNLRSEAQTLGALASLAELQKRPTEAEAYYEQAVALCETLRTEIGALSEVKAVFLSSHIEIYYAYLRFLIQQKKLNKAFELAQKTKARALLDLMTEGRIHLSGTLSPEERQQEQALRQKADSLNTQMIREGVENEVGAKKRFEALKQELLKTESQLQTLTDALYARYPDLAQKRVARTATAAEVSKLLPQGTLLLDYMVLDQKQVVVFVVAAQGLTALLLPIAYPRLVAKAAALRAACADPRKSYQAVARELSALLIAPVQKHLAGAKRLVVCPDGALWDVPFQALLMEGQFLAQRYELAYAYSATGAQVSLTTPGTKKRPSKSLLVLADPDFGSAKRFGDLDNLPGQRPIDSASRPIDSPSRPIDSASRPIDSASRPIDSASRPIDTASRPIDSPSRPIDSPSRPIDSPSRAFDSVSRGKAIAALPGTRREAQAIKKLFPDATLLTGKQAQEGEAKRTASAYKYLHFATHGFFNDASPLLSSLILAAPTLSGTKGDDGFLTAREIFDLNLSAELVVLSACNTARGRQRTGDGIIGLTWALFAAGCSTQVVSQWAVDDASTATLMTRFYDNLVRKKLSKGGALRQASLSLMQSPKHAHPYYWAPFVLLGDWR